MSSESSQEAVREGNTARPSHLETQIASAPHDELALNRQLEADPLSVSLNVGKADSRVLAGDDELACYFYRRALRYAATAEISVEEAAVVHRAERALAEAAERSHAKRVARLEERGLPASAWSPRLRHSLDLAASARPYGLDDEAHEYPQDPTHFLYTGLPRIQFYEREAFDWAPAFEAATADIRDELIGLLERSSDSLRPFARNVDGLPLGVSKALPQGSDWSVLALCEQGWLEPRNVEQCPRTWDALLNLAPVPRVAGWGPSAVFSLLKSGAHIGAHTGMYNSRLICHLPLIVPPGCRFRVGDEVREWEEGKLLIFDDTIEHEAWNSGAEDRVVLVFDIWRPELSERERDELTRLFSD